MTVKQQKFASLFVELGNASKAAKQAGYSEKYAARNADSHAYQRGFLFCCFCFRHLVF